MQTLHRPTEAQLGSGAALGGAWLLDVEGFHDEFEALFAALSTPQGPAPLRARATQLWESDDPLVRAYVGRVETETPEEWEVGFDEGHLGQWYRLLMAAHVEPARPLRGAEAVRTRLPELGFSPAYARRLALGREIAELATGHASPAVGAAMELVLGPGHRGWLSHEDITFALERLSQIDRRCFRDAQDLVPICEDLWGALSAASTDESSALLILPSQR